MNEFATERNRSIHGMIEAKKLDLNGLNGIISEFLKIDNADFTDFDRKKISDAMKNIEKAQVNLENARKSIRILLG